MLAAWWLGTNRLVAACWLAGCWLGADRVLTACADRRVLTDVCWFRPDCVPNMCWARADRLNAHTHPPTHPPTHTSPNLSPMAAFARRPNWNAKLLRVNSSLLLKQTGLQKKYQLKMMPK